MIEHLKRIWPTHTGALIGVTVTAIAYLLFDMAGVLVVLTTSLIGIYGIAMYILGQTNNGGIK